MSDIRRIVKTAFAKYAADTEKQIPPVGTAGKKPKGPDTPAGVGTKAQAWLPGTELTDKNTWDYIHDQLDREVKKSPYNSTVPQDVGELSDLFFNTLLPTYGKLPLPLARNTYGSQRFYNAAQYLNRNPHLLGPFADVRFDKDMKYTTTGTNGKSIEKTKTYPNPAIEGLLRRFVTPYLDVYAEGTKPSSDNRGDSVVSPAASTALSNDLHNPGAGPAMTQGQLVSMRQKMANSLAKAMGFIPGTQQFVNAVKYLISRGAENQEFWNKGILHSNPKPTVEAPGEMKPYQKQLLELGGHLMGNNAKYRYDASTGIPS